MIWQTDPWYQTLDPYPCPHQRQRTCRRKPHAYVKICIQRGLICIDLPFSLYKKLLNVKVRLSIRFGSACNMPQQSCYVPMDKNNTSIEMHSIKLMLTYRIWEAEISSNFEARDFFMLIEKSLCGLHLAISSWQHRLYNSPNLDFILEQSRLLR